MEKAEIILSGMGGQGLLLAGLILGDAAAIYENKYATQTESYAPLARGGSSKSEIIISNQEIDYPKVRKADILVAMTREAYDSEIQNVKPDGLVIVDSAAVHPTGNIPTLELPLTQIARESTGKAFTISIASLGVIARHTGVISLPALLRSISSRAPRGTEDINRKAAKAGALAAEQVNNS